MKHGVWSAFVVTVSSLIVIQVHEGHAAILENPGDGAFMSGIGVISGWKCEANGPITVRFNGGNPITLVYGSERGDTRVVCGDADNGFIAQMNWSLLGDGTHMAVIYDNNVEFARSVFTVRGFRDAFVTGASTTVSAQDFPSQGETAVFSWSQATQHLELVDAFGAPTENDPPDCEGWTTANNNHNASYLSAEWVQACLEAGADPNARDEDGETPLHHVGDLSWIPPRDTGKMASLLLMAGADPNARNNRGQTPLHRAAEDGLFEMIVVLLEAGADLNVQDENSETPLHMLNDADVREKSDAERALIRAGADPNILASNGRPYVCSTFECLEKKTYRMAR